MEKIHITETILYELSDGELHTTKELANKLGVSVSTVRRNLQYLSCSFPIHSFHGGDDLHKGGIKLDISGQRIFKSFSEFEKEIIIKGLNLLLEKYKSDKTNKCNNVIHHLIKRFMNSKRSDFYD